MAHTTITRSDLTEAIANQTGLQKNEASIILQSILEEMTRGLVKEGVLKLSSFGSFAVRQKNSRVGRNPKTGEEVVITPRRTISFRASHILKKKVEKIPA
ncbi:integration host factor subunit alpha [Candidatus Nucleicultrix amoebiphila]|jgi:integration host factor subunit alpha|uniref:Integration host factor subunit alpha n=1 Tax=Candidatus Nucleicultrix amoebiphila FS5 TaxID=1414854 RepID=A0A1W6N6P9_9PROT|nr:integration host factor subunit alpha [Candidatus Nucleicultrix amoebiphila]ARN85426.1 integration host factor subunit alpha [Candidatus Nucleicultrix amoebiphila FS5]